MASTDSVAPPRAATGIVLMVVAMLMIPIVDGQAKYLSAGYSPLFISWARYPSHRHIWRDPFVIGMKCRGS